MSQHVGQMSITDEQSVHGQVTGTIFVKSGGVLHLHGQACGGIIIEVGGEAHLHGQSTKNVVNDGKLWLYGQICGRLLGHMQLNPYDQTEHMIIGKDKPVPVSGLDGSSFTYSSAN